MHDRVKTKRSQIINLMVEEEYEECIKECDELLNSLSNDKTNKDNFRFCYFMMAKASKNLYGLRNMAKTKQLIKNAIQYVVCDSDYIRLEWLLAECFLLECNYKEVVQIYKRCLQYYKYSNNRVSRLFILFNLCKIYNRPSLMTKLIDIYINDGEYDKQTLNDSFKEIANLFLENDDLHNFHIILHKVDDIKIRQELLEKANNTFVSLRNKVLYI